MSDFPPPPFEPDAPTPPPSLTVPLPPPLVGEGSPWAPIDAENRDHILDWWRMWWRRVFFPWIIAWIQYWADQWARLATYLNTWITAADAYIVEHAIAGYSFRTTATDIAGTGTTDVVFTSIDVDHRPIVLGDLVLDQSADGNWGIVTVLIDDTHATVQFLGSLRGPQGIQGIQGIQGLPGLIQSIVAGANITVDNTDPANPIVTATGTGGGVVVSVVAGTAITVDSTDPANPVVAVDQENLLPIETVALPDPADWTGQIIYAQGIPAVDDGPYYSDGTTWTLIGSGGGGGGVASVVAGANVAVDDTDPANPVVSVDTSTGGLVSSITIAPASTVTDQPVNLIGTTADPELQFNMIETSDGSGNSSEFGGPATHLRMKADDSVWTNNIDFLANGINLSSTWNSTTNGGSIGIYPGSSDTLPGGIALNGVVNLLQLAADPVGSFVDGAIYFNTTSNTLRIYYVGAWH